MRTTGGVQYLSFWGLEQVFIVGWGGEFIPIIPAGVRRSLKLSLLGRSEVILNIHPITAKL